LGNRGLIITAIIANSRISKRWFRKHKNSKKNISTYKPIEKSL
jgi:hypothetical protein